MGILIIMVKMLTEIIKVLTRFENFTLATQQEAPDNAGPTSGPFQVILFT